MLFSLFLLLVLTLHQANSQTCTNVASYVSDGLYYFYEEANNGDQCKQYIFGNGTPRDQTFEVKGLTLNCQKSANILVYNENGQLVFNYCNQYNRASQAAQFNVRAGNLIFQFRVPNRGSLYASINYKSG